MCGVNVIVHCGCDCVVSSSVGGSGKVSNFVAHQSMMMNGQFCHSSSGCHVAVGKAAPAICVNSGKGHRGAVTYCEWWWWCVPSPSHYWALLLLLGIFVDGVGCGGRAVDCWWCPTWASAFADVYSGCDQPSAQLRKGSLLSYNTRMAQL